MLQPIIHYTNRERWNEFVVNAPTGHLMQGYEWGQFKAATGWRVQRVALERQGQLVAGAQLLFRSLPGLPFTLAYLSKGPMVHLTDELAVNKLWQLIHDANQQQQAIFLMVEPNLLDTPANQAHLQQQGCQRSQHTNHPHSTIVIDLSPDETTLMKQMRKKTRQLIRKAGRSGVEIVPGTQADLAEFHQILETTADIKEIPTHEASFYEQAWQNYQPTSDYSPARVKLFLAKYEGQTVAAKMVFIFGQRSMHLWGGTSRQGRDLNASYLIQWESIRWAKQQGCRYCDLWGIPDEVGQLLKQGDEVPKDKQTGLWGVYTFKRGFGGEVEAYVGTYDYVYRPAWYHLAQTFTRFSIDTLSTWLEKWR